jgi:hypothetical protein
MNDYFWIFALCLSPLVGALLVIGVSEVFREINRYRNRHLIIPYGTEWAGYFEGDEE